MGREHFILRNNIIKKIGQRGVLTKETKKKKQPILVVQRGRRAVKKREEGLYGGRSLLVTRFLFTGLKSESQ